MNVLVACEFSGVVRDAFRANGHYAKSCDLLPSDNPVWGMHYKGDVMDIIDQKWDLMIAHPPCTYLCASGLHWNKTVPDREEETEDALQFVRGLMEADIPRIAIENPVGCISTRIRKADQMIQPYDFGENASKRTCLWLKNLPKLKPTERITGRMVNGKERWENQTDSGQNRVPPSPDRWKYRSVTYPGIAKAMADQWGGVV